MGGVTETGGPVIVYPGAMNGLVTAVALVAFVAGTSALGQPEVGTRVSERVEAELLIVDKSAGQLVRLDLVTGTVTARIDVGFGPHEVAVVPPESSPTGGPLAAVSLYGTGPQPGSSVAFVDLATGGVAEVSVAPFTRPHGLAHVPGSRLLLVTAEAQDSLLVLELAAAGSLEGLTADGGAAVGSVVASVPLASRLPHMVVTAPGGGAGFVSAITGASVSRVDLADLVVTPDRAVAPEPAVRPDLAATTQVGPSAEGIAVTPDGDQVWVGSNGAHRLHVLDAATLEQVAVVPTCAVPIRVTAVGANLMAATCMDDAEVQLFDAVSRELVSSVTLPGATGSPVGTLATRDGTRIYVATTADGRVHEIDVAAGSVVRTFDVGVEPDGLAFGPATSE